MEFRRHCDMLSLVMKMRGNGIAGNLPEYMEEVGVVEPYLGYKFKVADVLTISILGTICGLQNMKMIYKWTTTERIKDFLRENFGIVFIPKYVQFTNILGNVNANELNLAFIKWAKNLYRLTTKLHTAFTVFLRRIRTDKKP